MAPPKTKGRCYACRRLLAKSGMTRHLATCPERQKRIAHADKQTRSPRRRILQLHIEGFDRPEYWKRLEVPAEMTLLKLDNYLRMTWLECCGHMSCFTIGDDRYGRKADAELGFKSMARARIGELVEPNDWFGHEYDFGTTTVLRLGVIDQREGVFAKDRIEPLAVNEPPNLRCACGASATQVCVVCMCEADNCYLCNQCAPEHTCGEEMLLPVVNSPRMGMCGYSATEPDFA